MKKLVFFFLILLLVLTLSSCAEECQHLYISREITPPDCDSAGRTTNKCLDCSFTYHSDFTPPTGHSFTKQTIAPTCTEPGYTLYTCGCSHSYKSDFTPPANHAYVSSKIEPSCSEGGYTLYFCSCGASYRSDHTPPLGHSYEVTNQALADCSHEGFTEYTCIRCADSYRGGIIPPTGHNFKQERFYPTCVSGGHTLNTCADCGYSYKSDYIFYSDIIESAFTDNSRILAKGIDVSKWNHQLSSVGEYQPLDWNAIKAQGFDFVILKAGSTLRNNGLSGGIEPTFEADYAAAREAGLCVGVYFYTYAHSVKEIELDAYALMEFLKGKRFEFPIYLDMEEESQRSLGKDTLGDMCEKFISTLQANGYYAGVYLNNSWLSQVFDRVEMTTLFDLWYARYPGTDTPVWNEEKYGKQLGMWQFTQSGTIEGIPGNFDMNYSYRDYPSIIKQWHLNGY